MSVGRVARGWTEASTWHAFVAPRPGSVLVQVLVAAGLAAASVAFLNWISEEAPGPGVLLASGLLFTACLFPGVRWLLVGRRIVPIFELICLSYAAHFGVSGILLPDQFRTARQVLIFTDGELQGSLLSVALGVTVMVIAYEGLLLSRLVRRLPVLDVRVDRRCRALVLPVAAALGIAATAAQSAGVAPSTGSILGLILRLLSAQLEVVVALLAYLVLPKRRLHLGYAALFAVTVTLTLMVGITTSMVESLLLIPIIIGLVGLQFRRWMVIVLLAATALVYLFLLQPVKAQYRAELYRFQGELTLPDKFGLWLDATQSYLERDSSAPPTTSTSTSGSLATLQDSLRRLDFIHIFSMVRSYTPSVVPYYGGTAYSYFLVGWVPRFLWPDKPGALDSNINMVLDYGMLDESELSTTSMSVGQLPEAYANFGYVGIVGVMLVQGLFLAALAYVFGAGRSVVAQGLLAGVLVELLNGVGADTAEVYGTLLENLVICTVVFWLLLDQRGPLARGLNALSGRLAHPVAQTS